MESRFTIYQNIIYSATLLTGLKTDMAFKFAFNEIRTSGVVHNQIAQMIEAIRPHNFSQRNAHSGVIGAYNPPFGFDVNLALPFTKKKCHLTRFTER